MANLNEAIQRIKTLDMGSFLVGLPMVGNKYICPFPDCNSGDNQNKTSAFKVFDFGYKCFSCQRGGDQIQFVIDYHGLGFRDAVIKICNDFGIPLDISEASGKSNRDRITLIQTGMEYKPNGFYRDGLEGTPKFTSINVLKKQLRGENASIAKQEKFYTMIMQFNEVEDKLFDESIEKGIEAESGLFPLIGVHKIYQSRIVAAKEYLKAKPHKVLFDTHEWMCIMTYLLEGDK